MWLFYRTLVYSNKHLNKSAKHLSEESHLELNLELTKKHSGHKSRISWIMQSKRREITLQIGL